MRTLVTGAGGFVGRHLLACLSESATRIAALGSGQPPASADGAEWLLVDVRDAQILQEIIGRIRPDAFFHLAGRPNSVPLSELFSTNVQGTLNLLEAVREHVPEAVVMLASSGAVYGVMRADQQPIKEESPLNPITPYGVSKMAADLLSYHYAAIYGLRVIRVRPFNLIGPGQSAQFACAAFAQQLARMKFGLQNNVLHVGNLNSSRDFLDVRDAARGFIMLAERGKPGEAYNLCSGRSTAIVDVLNQLVAISGLDIEIRTHPARLQKEDVPAQIGSYAKAQQTVGWTPEFTLKQTLREMWGDWCARVQGWNNRQ